MGLNIKKEISNINALLGDGGAVEIVPMFIPVQTYKIILELGKERGISPADVISNALVLYAQPKQDIQTINQSAKRADIVLKRNK